MAGEALIALMIAGDAGARVEGSCVLRTATGETVEAIAATVPFERRWRGSNVRCTLAADGHVTVELSRGASRTRTSTSGGTLIVQVG